MKKKNRVKELPKKTSWGYFKNLIFFLFIFLLPTQLGKHFFLPFSYLSGVRIDYLAPTIYLIDLLVLLLIIFNFDKLKSFFSQKHILSALFLLAAIIPFSLNPFISIYSFIKIVEVLCIFTIFRQTKLKENLLLGSIALSAFIETVLAILQLTYKHSLQGIFYFLGERYLNLSMPDMAKASLNGVEILRPYGTFSHPNSMAGFYLLIYTFVLSKEFKNFWLKNSILLLSTILILISFSKAAIGVFLLVNLIFLFKDKKIDCWPCILSRIVVFTVVSGIFLMAKTDPNSLLKRVSLIKDSVAIFASHPLFGVGLGAYLAAQVKIQSSRLFLLPQPVHNIFLLWLAQTGIVGLAAIYFLLKEVKKSALKYPLLICLAVVVLTGMIDHYWLTLEQNWLLLGVIFGLI